MRTIYQIFFLTIASCGFLLTSAIAQSADTEPVVTITSGQIRGNHLPSGRAEFLGIPFAQPPIGDLRWHEPVLPKPWSGIRDAKEFGAPCAQNVAGDWNKKDAERSQEDCLYLNVITPQWPPKTPLPVMFWLHGGANTGGTASAALYKDGTLVEHGTVLVTANYRLDIFGFFAHPELTRESAHHSSGNYAILDQIAALKWVRDNIAKFGGDPHNITVFGQSAGALDTGLLMTSPLSKDLFQRAIGESGTVLLANPPALSFAEQGGVKFAEDLHAPATDAIKYLRSLPASDLLKAVLSSQHGGPDGPNASPQYRPWPNIDGWVFPELPAKVFADGREAAIPLIIGNNTREFDGPDTLDAVRNWMQGFYGDLAPKAFAAYGIDNGGQGSKDALYGPVGNQWAADFIFRCPATAVAGWHTAAHHPTYEYQFERAIPGQEAQGAVHSADLPYVFGFYPKSGNISGAFTDVDFKLADTIEKYWTTFARTGDPNEKGAPAWPVYDGNKAYVRFTEEGQVSADTALRDKQCGLYRERVKQVISGMQNK